MLVAVLLVTEHRVEVVGLSEAGVIVANERELVGVGVVAGLGQVGGGVAAEGSYFHIGVVCVIDGHPLAEGLALAYGPGRLVACSEAQAFYRLVCQGNVSGNDVAAAALVTAFAKYAEGVGTARLAHGDASVRIESEVNARVHVGGLERSDGRVVLLGVPEREVHVSCQPLGDIDAVAYAGGHFLVVRTFVEGVGVVVAEGSPGLYHLVAVAEGEVVVVRTRELLDYVGFPVEVRILDRVILVHLRVVVDIGFRIGLVISALRTAGIVPLVLVEHGHIVVRVGEVLGPLGGCDHRILTVVTYAQLTFLGRFGGDEDNAGSCTGTIDGSGGGVLQDGYLLHVVAGHLVNAAHSHSVHQDERAGTVDTGHTSDFERGGCSRH